MQEYTFRLTGRIGFSQWTCVHDCSSEASAIEYAKRQVEDFKHLEGFGGIEIFDMSRSNVYVGSVHPHFDTRISLFSEGGKK